MVIGHLNGTGRIFAAIAGAALAKKSNKPACRSFGLRDGSGAPAKMAHKNKINNF